MTDPNSRPNPSSVAEDMARQYFGVTDDPASVRRAVRQWLISALSALILVPLLFYLRFGEVGPLAWGTTVFLTVYCLLAAVGVYFLRRPAYHTPVAPRFDWLDRIGAFWLVACAFGPFFGWLLPAVIDLSVSNWRWVYGGRVVFSIVLPMLTALPLLRYVRGRGAIVMLALLIGVTALPVWSAWATWQDLWVGPVADELYLPHTAQYLAP